MNMFVGGEKGYNKKKIDHDTVLFVGKALLTEYDR